MSSLSVFDGEVCSGRLRLAAGLGLHVAVDSHGDDEDKDESQEHHIALQFRWLLSQHDAAEPLMTVPEPSLTTHA